MKNILTALMFSAALLLTPLPASPCTVCHSKNPKMVSMHRALEFKDCFTCHGRGLATTPEERQKQMVSDSRCSRCHGKKG